MECCCWSVKGKEEEEGVMGGRGVVTGEVRERDALEGGEV